MRFDKVIVTVDSHTAGEPTRVVVGGVPYIRGRTMEEKREYVKRNFDYIRSVLMQEPRGHRDMFGAIITPPIRDDSDFGVVWIDCAEYPDMCGHGSIGVAMTAVECGLVKKTEPITEVAFDTPAGQIKALAKIVDGSVDSVTIRHVPSFLYKSTTVKLPSVGDVPVDVSFGGNFFAIVKAEDIGVRVRPENSRKLTEIGMTIKNSISAQMDIQHPLKPYINSLLGTRIIDESSKPGRSVRNVVIFSEGQVDRSPCGTGTCAHMAMLYAKKGVELGEEVTHESIIGTSWKSRVVEETKVHDFKAVIPEVIGRAYITGFHKFIIDPDDPLREGFLLI